MTEPAGMRDRGTTWVRAAVTRVLTLPTRRRWITAALVLFVWVSVINVARADWVSVVVGAVIVVVLALRLRSSALR